MLQMMSTGAARRILLPLVRGQEKAVIVASKLRQFTVTRRGRASPSEEVEGIWKNRVGKIFRLKLE